MIIVGAVCSGKFTHYIEYGQPSSMKSPAMDATPLHIRKMDTEPRAMSLVLAGLQAPERLLKTPL